MAGKTHYMQNVMWNEEQNVEYILPYSGNGVFIVWQLERTLKKHMRASQGWNKIFPET